jgi:hypothetical protein
MIYKKKKIQNHHITIIRKEKKNRSSAKPFLFYSFLFVFQPRYQEVLVLLRLSAFCRLHHRKKKISWVEKQREGDENIIAK